MTALTRTLGNLNVKYKLLLVLLVPTFVAGYFAIGEISSQRSVVNDNGRLQDVAEVSTILSAYVHETQKERGATGVFVGSGGERFRQELPAQRLLTDARISDARAALATFDAAAFGADFEANLATAVGWMDGLPAHRNQVDALAVSGAVGITYYTNMNAAFLDVIGHVARLSTDAEVANQVTAYVSYLQGKERAGIERAVMSNAFARGVFAEGEFAKFNGLVVAQDTFFSVFASFAQPQQVAFFERTVSGPPVDAVNDMRAIAAAHVGAETLGGVDAGEWFAQMTAKINLLKEVEDSLSADLLGLTDALAGDASSAFWRTLLIAAAAAAIAMLIAWLVIRTIVGPLGHLLGAARALAQGDLNHTAAATGCDEIGLTVDAFGAAAASLRETAAAATQIAAGDVTADVTPKSDADVLGHAFLGMTRYLRGMAGAAERIAAGDLTVEVESQSEKDALGNAFVAMTDNLNEVLSQVSAASTGLAAAKAQLGTAAGEAAAASSQVATTTGQVAEGTGDQARSVQEVNNSVAKVTSSAAAIEDQAKTSVADAAVSMAARANGAANGAAQAISTAHEGADAVQKTVDGMERIRSTVASASEEIKTLGERSTEIGKIVAVIDDIAAQTNLLALNAAIEAARAGEQGRGFAVVADEVRKLAERVGGATKEIADLIGGVQQSVDSSVAAMLQGATETESGSQVAAEAGASLRDILAAVESVTTEINALSTDSGTLESAGGEMVELIGEILTELRGVSEAVTAIAAIAEENSAATQEVSAAAQEMSAQVTEVQGSADSVGRMADELAARVASFRLRESDGAAPGQLAVQSREGDSRPSDLAA